ncbi:MAG: LLM class flavin-dependent oxidoreductase [Actinomycetales bacterium]
MTTLSITCPITSPDPSYTAGWVALAATLDVPVWFGQASTIPLSAGVGLASGRNERATVGQGVTLIPTTTVFDAATQANAITRLTGQATRAYFSPGFPELQQHLLGAADPHPLRTTRTFIERLDTCLHGLGVRENVELGLGVLRPGMARLAGRIADGALTWLVGSRYLADVLVPALDAGAAAAGRQRPRVVSTIHTSMRPNLLGETLRACVSRAFGAHLSAPHYRNLLQLQGCAVSTVSANGDRGPDAQDLDAVLALGLFSPLESLPTHLRRLSRSGADEIAIVMHDLGSAQDVARLWPHLQEQLTTPPTPGSTAPQSDRAGVGAGLPQSTEPEPAGRRAS